MLLGLRINRTPRVVAFPFYRPHTLFSPSQTVRKFSDDPREEGFCKEFSHLLLDGSKDEPLAALKEKIGTTISLPHLKVHPQNLMLKMFLTRQRFEILQRFFDQKSFFLSLSGPRGVGKSFIGYAAACIAYVNRKPLFYQPDPQLLMAPSTRRIWNNFVSLNQFVEHPELQSFISEHSSETKINMVSFCDLLEVTNPVRIVDEIQLAYDGSCKELHPDISRAFFNLINSKDSESGGRLLAIGSANALYNVKLHDGLKSFQITVQPPPMDEFLEMLSQLAQDKLSSLSPSDVDKLLQKTINDLGTPRNVTNFLNQLPSISDEPTFLAALQRFFDVLVESTQKVVLTAFDSLGQNSRYMLKTMRRLIVDSAPPIPDDHTFRDCGLVYYNGKGLVATGRFVQKAFLNFLCARDLLYGPMADATVTGSHEGAMFEKWLKIQILKSGFVTDFSAQTGRNWLRIEKHYGTPPVQPSSSEKSAKVHHIVRVQGPKNGKAHLTK